MDDHSGKRAGRSTMDHPGRWYGISLGIHVAMMLLFAFFSARLPPTKVPVVIDLTIDTPPVRELPAPYRGPRAPATVAISPPISQSTSNANQAVPPLAVPVRIPDSPAPTPASRDVTAISAGTTKGGKAVVSPVQAAGSGGTFNAEQPAGGQGEPPEKAKNRYLKEHFTYIRDLVMKRLVYPAQARKLGWAGKVMVSFVVCEDGTARGIRVLESSGYPMLDRCAIDTVRAVAPFPKPPLQAEIVIPIQFKLM